MIKLNLTHEFTGRDIKDAAAPDVGYKAYVFWEFEARGKALDFVGDGSQDVALALEGLNLLLVSVTFEGQVHPVTLEWLEQYRDDIEAQNPSLGDWYMCKLARDIFNYQYNYTEDRLGNSLQPLPASKNGNGTKHEKSPAKA